MSKNLNKKEIEKFSRQIILKNIGAVGQKKILSSKVLIVGMGGLGCPVAEFLTRSRSEERRVGKECRSRWSPYH